MIFEFAPAKLNLYLHITGRRVDGYHDLDSLVAFASVGDDIRLEKADKFQFHIDGPQADALKHEPFENNLAVKAAHSLAELTHKKLDVSLTLVKKLPIASGIGGGSSDAAAALRALAKYWGIPLNDRRLLEAAAKHGQDVPVCLKTESLYMTATGTAPGPELPHADIILINPNKSLPTPDVYKQYRANNRDFSPKAQLAKAPADLDEFINELKVRHNDLALPAQQLMPEISTILDVLERTDGCLLRRMSGSGATCFGIYNDRNLARSAAAAIKAAYPDWWVVQSYIPYKSDPRQGF